jgi:hypothetical protein
MKQQMTQQAARLECYARYASGRETTHLITVNRIEDILHGNSSVETKWLEKEGGQLVQCSY